MDYRSFLIAMALAGFGGAVQAGYAELSPPPGWAPGTGASTRTYAPAANEAWTSERTVRTHANLNVGGTATRVPAAMRMAANAGQFAARAYFGWPLTAAMILLPLGVSYLDSQGVYFDTETMKWMKRGTSGGTYDAYDYSFNGGNTWYGELTEGSRAHVASRNPNPPPGGVYVKYVFVSARQYSPGVESGYYYRTEYTNCSNCSQHNQTGLFQGASERVKQIPIPPNPGTEITLSEMESTLGGIPFPGPAADELNQALRNMGKAPVPLPVLDPVVNPVPQLSPNPEPQPLTVPEGSPQAIPNTSPQRYTQPVTTITGRPTTDSPWRVEVVPGQRESTNPDGLTEPGTDGTPEGTTPKTPEQVSLCEQFPDISACAKLGTAPAGPAIPTKEVALSMTKDEGWQLGSSSCPAPKTVNINGKSLSFDLQLMCDFATMIKPIVVGMAYLGALLTFFGMARKD